jgi:hypothetical protein
MVKPVPPDLAEIHEYAPGESAKAAQLFESHISLRVSANRRHPHSRTLKGALKRSLERPAHRREVRNHDHHG